MAYLDEWTSVKDEFEALTGLNTAAQKTWGFRKSATIDKTLKGCDHAHTAFLEHHTKEALVDLNGSFGTFSTAKAQYLFVLEAAVATDVDLRWQEKAAYERAVTLLETKLSALEAKIRREIMEADSALSSHPS